MTRTECAHVVTDTVQVVLERPDLGPRVVHVLGARGLTGGNEAGEVQPVERENDGRLGLVPEPTAVDR